MSASVARHPLRHGFSAVKLVFQLFLEGRHLDARIFDQGFTQRNTLLQRQKNWSGFSGDCRVSPSTELIEAKTLQGHFRHQQMPLMRRVERTAEQPDDHAGFPPAAWSDNACRPPPHSPCVRGRVWPVPCTRYLNVVNCSTPTGPRACILPVEMPISPPMPNSPPSANWVEALCSRIAESSFVEEAGDNIGVFSNDRLRMVGGVGGDMVNRTIDAIDDSDRDDRIQIFPCANLLPAPP